MLSPKLTDFSLLNTQNTIESPLKMSSFFFFFIVLHQEKVLYFEWTCITVKNLLVLWDQKGHIMVDMYSSVLLSHHTCVFCMYELKWCRLFMPVYMVDKVVWSSNPYLVCSSTGSGCVSVVVSTAQWGTPPACSLMDPAWRAASFQFSAHMHSHWRFHTLCTSSHYNWEPSLRR